MFKIGDVVSINPRSIYYYQEDRDSPYKIIKDRVGSSYEYLAESLKNKGIRRCYNKHDLKLLKRGKIISSGGNV